MKKIETQTDFQSWIKDVNINLNNKPLCDLQDVFARTDMKELKAMFSDMTENEKEHAVFSIQKAMGSATLFEFIKAYSRQRAQDIIEREADEINTRWNAVLNKEREVGAIKTDLETTIKCLDTRVAELTKEYDRLTKEWSRNYVENINLRDNLEAMGIELEKSRVFEDKIKSMLKN